MKIAFAWDPYKERANERKHGFDFKTATKVFFDPFRVSRQDRTEDWEERWQTIGIVQGVTLLLVAHTVWDDGEVEYIRIISARRASRTERRLYEEDR